MKNIHKNNPFSAQKWGVAYLRQMDHPLCNQFNILYEKIYIKTTPFFCAKMGGSIFAPKWTTHCETGCNQSLTGLLSHSKTMDQQPDHSPEGLDRNHGPVQIGCGPVRLPVFLVFLDRTFKHYPRAQLLSNHNGT